MSIERAKIIEIANPAAETISVEEAARRLDVCPATYYEGVRAGTLPGVYAGKRVIVTRAGFEAFVRVGCMPKPQAVDAAQIARMLTELRVHELEARRDALTAEINELRKGL